MKEKKILFVKPPDRFLQDEFVFQQLGPHYLQSFLQQYDIKSDLLILHEPKDIRLDRESGKIKELTLDQLNMLFIDSNESKMDIPFNKAIFADYDIVAFSVMSPQAPDSYMISKLINFNYPNITTVIGGSHARYYKSSVETLPHDIAFDFVVPQDGWQPMLKLARNEIRKNGKSVVLTDVLNSLKDLPAPSRPLPLMEKYNFELAGSQAFHTITALGCPFTCYFCESGTESVRKFSDEMIANDLEVMAKAHKNLGHDVYGVMFFDDVGLMTPKQVKNLAHLVSNFGYKTWRAFTHAYLVVKYGNDLLSSFVETGGRRIGMGLETGSQKSLDLINKRNGKRQLVEEHYEAVRISNNLGVAVDGFTMIYPWEDENDLKATTNLVEFIAKNPVNGIDEKGRPLRNSVDSTIMTPYQGTKFNELILLGEMPGVKMKDNIDPGLLFYKGNKGGSGWPYDKTILTRERYEEEQAYRNSLRPNYK